MTPRTTDGPCTLGNIRSHGCTRLLVFCLAPYCHHKAHIDGKRWPDDYDVKWLEPLMVCTQCGLVGADVRPDWSPMVSRKGRPSIPR
jgi:hypothetical protein